MSDDPIPGDIKRFILTSIDSVPHLEAVLLLRYDPQIEWSVKSMAQRLYLSEDKAGKLLTDLSAAGFAAVTKGDQPFYAYRPASPELKELLGRLAEIYGRHLVEVTNLIHSKISKQAQDFGDAFRWKDREE